MGTVAIVLSNYNHAHHLPDSLHHICNQTRPADQIIIVDDGSTDDSIDVISDFAHRFKNVEFIRNGENLGLQASIKKAISRVRCEYMNWAASDDRLLPNFLERNMQALDRHPSAALSFSETVVMDETGQGMQRFSQRADVRHIFDLSDLPEYVPPAGIRRRMKRAYLPISSNTVVVRTAALDEIGGFPGELRWHADSFAYVALALRHGVCALAEPLALIRPSATSYSQAMHDPVRQRVVLRAMLDLLSQPHMAEIRRGFKDCPSNFSPFGNLMLKEMASTARDWDLAPPFLLWRIKEMKDIYGLSWPATFRRLMGHGYRALRATARSRVRRMRGAP